MIHRVIAERRKFYDGEGVSNYATGMSCFVHKKTEYLQLTPFL
jgi:hypothetical protein